LLVRRSGVAMTHVPYKGSADAMKDLLAGRVQLMFDSAASAIPNAKAGQLRILGVAAEQRSPLLPDVPTLSEQGYRGIDLTGWLAFFGPAKLPPDVVARLNAALVATLAVGRREGYVSAKGAYEAVSSSPEALAAMTRDAYDRWGKVVDEIGLRPR
jgi:tripartite-type tricarboxylate transporter receptor subunit TctC